MIFGDCFDLTRVKVGWLGGFDKSLASRDRSSASDTTDRYRDNEKLGEY